MMVVGFMYFSISEKSVLLLYNTSIASTSIWYSFSNPWGRSYMFTSTNSGVIFHSTLSMISTDGQRITNFLGLKDF